MVLGRASHLSFCAVEIRHIGSRRCFVRRRWPVTDRRQVKRSRRSTRGASEREASQTWRDGTQEGSGVRVFNRVGSSRSIRAGRPVSKGQSVLTTTLKISKIVACTRKANLAASQSESVSELHAASSIEAVILMMNLSPTGLHPGRFKDRIRVRTLRSQGRAGNPSDVG